MNRLASKIYSVFVEDINKPVQKPGAALRNNTVKSAEKKNPSQAQGQENKTNAKPIARTAQKKANKFARDSANRHNKVLDTGNST